MWDKGGIMTRWWEEFMDSVSEQKPKLAPRRDNLIIFPKTISVDDKEYLPLMDGMYEEIGGEG
jgi:hypothetical protein